MGLEIKQLTRLQIIRYCEKLEKENKNLKEDVEVWKNANKILRMHDAKMEYENQKLKEKTDVLEKAKFEVMAYINMCYPKTYMEAEKLQKMKETFERIYNEKLYFLEKENNELKEEIGKLVMNKKEQN